MWEIIRPTSLHDVEVALTVLAEAGRSPDLPFPTSQQRWPGVSGCTDPWTDGEARQPIFFQRALKLKISP
jgi:hypothetical protein